MSSMIADILADSHETVTLKKVARIAVRAKYDAAATTVDNRRHWANADGLSADADASPAVRELLRNRNRYEATNNGYMKGMLNTHAFFVIGTGPRLQMQTPSVELNRFVEKEFGKWCKKVRLAKKLRTARKTKAASGEAFIQFTTNSKIKHRVKLDLSLIEADRVRSLTITPMDPREVDGIVFDEEGNPFVYRVLKYHPGAINTFVPNWQTQDIPAERIIHLFDWDRPEQSRGVPEMTASLPLFAMLRRYTLAVVRAAEVAAENSAVMQTTTPGDEGAADLDLGQTMETERGMLTALPEGWTMAQMHAEQPTTQYGDFKGELVTEAGRPINMPANIAKGDSSKYNYASGRLDHQTYFKSIEVEHDDLEIEAMDRIFEAWLNEAALIEGYLPKEARALDFDPDHQWFWDGVGHVDPQKEANAQETRLRNHTSTLADEYAAAGKDWEVQIRQRAKEIKLMEELGVPLERPEIIQVDKGEEVPSAA